MTVNRHRRYYRSDKRVSIRRLYASILLLLVINAYTYTTVTKAKADQDPIPTESVNLESLSPTYIQPPALTFHPGSSNTTIQIEKRHQQAHKVPGTPVKPKELVLNDTTTDVVQRLQKAITDHFGASQWESAKELVRRESGFNPCSYNPGKSDCSYRGKAACGLPQALPCTKLLNAIGSLDNIDGQIQWFIGYIEGRYKTPQQALLFHNSHNWY